MIFDREFVISFRKKPKTTNEEMLIVEEKPDYVAIARALGRDFGRTLLVGVIIVIGTTVTLVTASQIIVNSLDNPPEENTDI